jgi:hypothetical protein
VDALEGEWRVERKSGLLPPLGLTKRIGEGRGVTLAFGVPVAWFRVEGSVLVYRGLPVRDVLTRIDEDTFSGEGRVLDRTFCRFRLVRDATRAPPSSV